MRTKKSGGCFSLFHTIFTPSVSPFVCEARFSCPPPKVRLTHHPFVNLDQKQLVWRTPGGTLTRCACWCVTWNLLLQVGVVTRARIACWNTTHTVLGPTWPRGVCLEEQHPARVGACRRRHQPPPPAAAAAAKVSQHPPLLPLNCSPQPCRPSLQKRGRWWVDLSLDVGGLRTHSARTTSNCFLRFSPPVAARTRPASTSTRRQAPHIC